MGLGLNHHTLSLTTLSLEPALRPPRPTCLSGRVRLGGSEDVPDVGGVLTVASLQRLQRDHAALHGRRLGPGQRGQEDGAVLFLSSTMYIVYWSLF